MVRYILLGRHVWRGARRALTDKKKDDIKEVSNERLTFTEVVQQYFNRNRFLLVSDKNNNA
jgi:hypothetical protein